MIVNCSCVGTNNTCVIMAVTAENGDFYTILASTFIQQDRDSPLDREAPGSCLSDYTTVVHKCTRYLAASVKEGR